MVGVGRPSVTPVGGNVPTGGWTPPGTVGVRPVGGWTIGPYAAFMLSDNWAVDGALSYSRLANDYSLAVLDGSYVSQRLTGSANLHGQYSLDFESQGGRHLDLRAVPSP